MGTVGVNPGLALGFERSPEMAWTICSIFGDGCADGTDGCFAPSFPVLRGTEGSESTEGTGLFVPQVFKE